MLRTTVYLDENVALAIRRLSERQQRSQAEVIREALAKYLEQAEGDDQRPELPGIGRYRSGRSDVSERAEEILREAAKARR